MNVRLFSLFVLASLVIHIGTLLLPLYRFEFPKQNHESVLLFISKATRSAEKKAIGRETFNKDEVLVEQTISQSPVNLSKGNQYRVDGLTENEALEITSDQIYKNGNELPTYPKEAIDQGWQGTVHLKLILSESGEVLQSILIDTSGYRILDLAALKASRQWKFDFHPPVKMVIAPVQFVIGS